jgi:hypothetical protein
MASRQRMRRNPATAGTFATVPPAAIAVRGGPSRVPVPASRTGPGARRPGPGDHTERHDASAPRGSTRGPGKRGITDDTAT